MDYSDMSFEERILVEAMQEAYSYNLPVSAVRMVYASLKDAAEKNRIGLSTSLQMRVNDVIKALTTAYDAGNAFVLRCEEIDRQCFDAMYKQHVARDLFVQELIRVIMDNPGITEPDAYVGLFTNGHAVAKERTLITGGRDRNTFSPNDLHTKLYVSCDDLLQKICEMSDTEFGLYSSKEEFADMIKRKIGECSVKNLDAF